jgi:hypothetical protein
MATRGGDIAMPSQGPSPAASNWAIAPTAKLSQAVTLAHFVYYLAEPYPSSFDVSQLTYKKHLTTTYYKWGKILSRIRESARYVLTWRPRRTASKFNKKAALQGLIC